MSTETALTPLLGSATPVDTLQGVFGEVEMVTTFLESLRNVAVTGMMDEEDPATLRKSFEHLALSLGLAAQRLDQLTATGRRLMPGGKGGARE